MKTKCSCGRIHFKNHYDWYASLTHIICCPKCSGFRSYLTRKKLWQDCGICSTMGTAPIPLSEFCDEE